MPTALLNEGKIYMLNVMLTSPVTARKITHLASQPSFQGGSQNPKADVQEKPADSVTKTQQKGAYQSPRPKSSVMGLMTALNDYWIFRGFPGLRSIPGVNKLPTMKGFNLKSIDLPDEDLERLKKAANPEKNIFFVTPNHPEFFTDMLVDKKVASKVSPSMAWMAANRIVAIAPRFMLFNNIIGNNGKMQGKEDSIKAAMEGQGMLLHPEGHSLWHGDKVHPLFPGAMEMAMMAVQKEDDTTHGSSQDEDNTIQSEGNAVIQQQDGKGRLVYVSPIAWKYEFNSDVSKGLHKEMAYLEKRLNLPSGEAGLSVGARFFKLHESLLSLQLEKFGFTEALKGQGALDKHSKLPYFQRQREFQEFLLRKLEQKYEVSAGQYNTEKRMRNLQWAVSKADRDKVSKEDRQILQELFRLEGFSPEVYNRPHLTQEHLHETLKRTAQSFFEGGLKTTFPKPAGSRTVHIRVADPIDVRKYVRKGMSDTERKQIIEQLTTQLQDTLQSKLDGINEEIAPSVQRFQKENPFYMAG